MWEWHYSIVKTLLENQPLLLQTPVYCRKLNLRKKNPLAFRHGECQWALSCLCWGSGFLFLPDKRSAPVFPVFFVEGRSPLLNQLLLKLLAIASGRWSLKLEADTDCHWMLIATVQRHIIHQIPFAVMFTFPAGVGMTGFTPRTAIWGVLYP